MLKHFAPALAVTALLAVSSAVFAADSATAPANQSQATPAAQSTDATAPK